MTRQLKAISAQELQKGRHWNQDGWFENFKELAAADLGYATSNNRDLNELEMTLARALRSGLNVYEDGLPASTTDGDAAAADDIREPPGEPTPVAIPKAPHAEEPPQAVAGSAPPAGGIQPQRTDAERRRPEGIEPEPLGQRTGVRDETDPRPDG